MCYSVESSFFTFGLGTALIIALFTRGLSVDKWNAVFSIPVILMQLVEGFMWLDLDNKKGWNNFMCKLVPIVIAAQPVCQVFGSLFQHPQLQYVAYIVLLVSMFASIGTMLKVGDKFATKGPNDHLQWPEVMPNWYAPIFFFFLITPMLLIKPTAQGITQFILALVCVAISRAGVKSKEFGSNWCWTTVYFFASMYILPLIIRK